MGITSKDIAAQRAILERGEEKRKALQQEAEREHLRDTFAAAALTGLIASREWPIDSEEAAHYCFRVADAMLRERERHHIPDAGKMVEKPTNHDAAPAAKAQTDSATGEPGGGGGCDWTDKPVTLPATGTGDIPFSRTRDICERLRRWTFAADAEPRGDLMDEAADEIDRLRLSEAEIDALEYVVEEGRIASMDDYGVLRSLLVKVRPDWETADSVSAIANCDSDRSQPFVAAYAVYINGEYDSSYGPDAIDEALEIAAECHGEVVPLYRSPTLTDEEREAIEQMLDEVAGKACAASWVPTTLRSLLARLA